MAGFAWTEHWVVRVARNAELDRADTLNILADTPMEEAWEEVGRVCGVNEDELAQHVATFFRYNVADFETAQRQARSSFQRP